MTPLLQLLVAQRTAGPNDSLTDSRKKATQPNRACITIQIGQGHVSPYVCLEALVTSGNTQRCLLRQRQRWMHHEQAKHCGEARGLAKLLRGAQ